MTWKILGQILAQPGSFLDDLRAVTISQLNLPNRIVVNFQLYDSIIYEDRSMSTVLSSMEKVWYKKENFCKKNNRSGLRYIWTASIAPVPESMPHHNCQNIQPSSILKCLLFNLFLCFDLNLAITTVQFLINKS